MEGTEWVTVANYIVGRWTLPVFTQPPPSRKVPFTVSFWNPPLQYLCERSPLIPIRIQLHSSVSLLRGLSDQLLEQQGHTSPLEKSSFFLKAILFGNWELQSHRDTEPMVSAACRAQAGAGGASGAGATAWAVLTPLSPGRGVAARWGPPFVTHGEGSSSKPLLLKEQQTCLP